MLRTTKRRVATSHPVEVLEGRTLFNGTYHQVSSGQFSQDWTNTGLIQSNNDWNAVPSIIGYTGIGTTSGQVINSGNFLNQTASTVNVLANQTDTNNNAGAVKEFELSNPTIGAAGSNSTGSPYIVLHMNTTGVSSVDVSYNVRDIEASADNAEQRVALQYRAGTTGSWTNVDAAYIADATTGPNPATLVTPVSVTLPPDAGNQPQLQLRIVVGNASGNDENVGIDDIVVKQTPVVQPPGSFSLPANGVRVNEDAGTATITVNRGGGSGGNVAVNYATSNGTALAGSDYTATSGTLSFASGQTTADITVPIGNDSVDEIAESLSVTLSNPTGGATLGSTTTTAVTILDNDGHSLASGPFTQDWSNVEQITVNNNFDAVPNIAGFSTDANRDSGIINVNANQANPNTFNTGGVAEFEIENPTIALIGSSTAPQPQLLLDVDTIGVTTSELSFTARDLEDDADNSTQMISVSYRVGSSGDFIEILNVPDVTIADATQATPLSVLLPAEALGQPLVQLRIATADAGGNDEAVGIDDIRVGEPLATPGSLAFAATNARFNEGAGTATVTVSRNGGSFGTVTVDYATSDSEATAGSDYSSTFGTLTFADGVTSQDIVVSLTQDSVDELGETFLVSLSNPTGGAELGTASTASVAIADDDGHVLATGPLSQDWTNTDLITTGDNWNLVPNITGYTNDLDRDAGVPDVVANQSNTNISNGGVIEFDGIENPTIALQASNAANAPQLVLDLNTTGVDNANLSFNARDLDATADNAVQNLRVSYRIGNSGDFIDIFFAEDVTTGPSLADMVTPVSVDLPTEAFGQELVQIRILTDDVPVGNNETVGIDDIVVSTETSGLPEWVAAGSTATWDGSTLTVTGPATIIADPAGFPGSDHPSILVNAGGALEINPASDLIVNVGSLDIDAGGTATIAAMTNGAIDRVLVVEGAISIDGKLDVTNNAMVLKNSSLAAVTPLIASGYAGSAWDGVGINSSAAASDELFSTAVGFASNADAFYNEFEGVTVDGDDILIKYTYLGDADLNGAANLDDYPLFSAGLDDDATGGSDVLANTWFYGDFDYNGIVNLDDFPLFTYGVDNNGVQE